MQLAYELVLGSQNGLLHDRFQPKSHSCKGFLNLTLLISSDVALYCMA